MAKALLVMEMPDNCRSCGLIKSGLVGYEGDIFCRITKENVYENIKNRTKPDSCPLQEVQEKKDERWSDGEYLAYKQGWNACIDAILGKKPEGV